MTRPPIGEDDKTPARSRAAEVIAITSVVLATAAEQLHDAGSVLAQAAMRCARDALVVDDLDATARDALLEDLEHELGAQAEAIHTARRDVRALRVRSIKGSQ